MIVKNYNYFKHRASNLVNKAVKEGTLIRPEFCEFCDQKGKIEGHHYKGYHKPLVVNWLCSKCHREAHVAIRKHRTVLF